jgi:hypothetical protein
MFLEELEYLKSATSAMEVGEENTQKAEDVRFYWV